MRQDKNNIIKIIASENCKDCSILIKLVNEFIKQNKLDFIIKKIYSSSNEAIEFGVEFDINSIPFVIFNNKSLIFSDKTTQKDIKELLM